MAVRRLISMTVLCLVLGTNANAACRDGRWIRIEGSSMMALRSNACHFWDWSQKMALRHLEPAWLETSVIVTGDPHHENFSHVSVNGKRIYVPNDLDDTGRAPGLLEFLKFLAVSRSVQNKESDLSTEGLLNAYLDGLREKKWPNGLPAFLEEDASVSLKDQAKDEEELVDKKEKKNQFKEEDDVTPWEKLTQNEQTRWNNLERRGFAAHFPRGWKVLDRALHVKGERGGIMGTQRYWFLMTDGKGAKHILEFKEIGDPATDLYESQKGTHAARLKNSLSIYWPELPPLYGVVEIGPNTFWMRPKYKNYVNYSVDEFRKKEKKFYGLSLYIAHSLGRWQAEQLRDKKYVERLEKDYKQLLQASKKFVDAYLAAASAAN